MVKRATMNISLPNDLRSWIESRARKDGCGTVSEYVRGLVRLDQQRREREEIDARLVAALESGPSAPMTAQEWAKIRADVAKRVSKRRAKRAG